MVHTLDNLESMVEVFSILCLGVYQHAPLWLMTSVVVLAMFDLFHALQANASDT
jgi:hypothetical protein